MSKKEYAVYRGDTLVAVGTSKEVAEQMGIKQKTLWWYTTPAYKKRVKSGRNKQEVIILDDKEE